MNSRRLLMILSLLGLSLSTNFALAAQKNPQMRTCRILKGQFFVAESATDQFGFCKFGSAIIGTIDLVRHQQLRETVLSIQTYENNINSCAPFGLTKKLITPDGDEVSVCAFGDGSLIESETLRLGIHAVENAFLNKALQE